MNMICQKLTAGRLVSCHVANVGTESDAVFDRQGVATRHSGGYGEETQRSQSRYGAARMPRLLRDRALVLDPGFLLEEPFGETDDYEEFIINGFIV